MKEVDEALVDLHNLRLAGYAVMAFSPEDLAGVKAVHIETAMREAGWHVINVLRKPKMTRKEMLERLVRHCVNETLANSGQLETVFLNGFLGFAEMGDDDLEQELKRRGLW